MCLLALAACTPSPRYVTIRHYQSSGPAFHLLPVMPVKGNDSIKQDKKVASESKKDLAILVDEKKTIDTTLPQSSWEAVFDTLPQKKQDTVVTESEQGIAAWFGPGFEGKKTASGEPFDSRKFTAAHKTLPFNTMVKVTNIDNDKSVVVRIIDRGPFTKNRAIDLSAAAAQVIGLDKSGIANVIIETIRLGP